MDCQITMKVDNWIEILESSYFQRLRMFIWEISAITITIMGSVLSRGCPKRVIFARAFDRRSF